MMIDNWRALILLVALSVPAHSAECPTASDQGFVLERQGVRSEFQKGRRPIVKVVNVYDTPPQQTVFLFRGLIELFRASKDQQRAIHTFSNLDDLFPLKAGARQKVSFVPLSPGETLDAPQSLELEVTGQETLSLGKCDYKVLRIKQTTRENDKLVDQQSVLYSPDLEAILARIYDEGTASELIVHYDSISTLTVD